MKENISSDRPIIAHWILNISNEVLSSHGQRTIERFHQTLKLMMKRYCFEHNGDWDAVRESF